MDGVTAEHLWKSYNGRPVLRDVSFRLEPGDIACLTAPSGAGKTTLLRLLMGLELPDRGRVLLPKNCRWAAVFQEDRLLDHLDGRENLRFVLGESYDETAASALLEELGLSDFAGQRVREYSGGMKRRLALARALLVPSDALALDEPFAGLDSRNRGRCLDAVRRRRGAGCVTFLATHDASDVLALGGRVISLTPLTDNRQEPL